MTGAERPQKMAASQIPSLRARAKQNPESRERPGLLVAIAPKKKQTDKLLILLNVMDEPPPSVLFHHEVGQRRCGTAMTTTPEDEEGADHGFDQTHHTDNGRRGRTRWLQAPRLLRNRLSKGNCHGHLRKGAFAPLRGSRVRLPVAAHRWRRIELDDIRLPSSISPFKPDRGVQGGLRCIAFDLATPIPASPLVRLEIDRPWDSHTDDQLALMDHLGIDKFMVGWASASRAL